ncbi:MAG: Flp pilus assembly complex ATPase component TadA [FCB group bacterium]|nr:Flp pilus assembly complex ATPase component TadA [FCB group bacterium]
MDEQLIAGVKSLLDRWSDKVPKNVFGVEKLVTIKHQVLMMMDQKEKDLLRNYVNMCLGEMRAIGASDIDIGGWGSRNLVWLRVQGVKKSHPEYGSFTLDESDMIISSVLMESQRDALYKNKSVDFSYSFPAGDGSLYRYRASVYFDLDDLSMNMRAINTNIRQYEGYGFHPNVTQRISLEYTKEGLVLVTGITGSGKSSTLDAIVDLNNRMVNAHIIIIASPLEYVHNAKKCIIRHREAGRDTLTFKTGTVEALRQDPDIIVIGEMRDPDTIMAGMEAADSGHKVISTLHTSSAIESLERIIGEFPASEQDRIRNRLADVLRCVISQKLVPGHDGKRVLAKEIMLMTPSIRSAIKNKNIGEIYQMLNEGSKFGMFTIEQDLKHLFSNNKITYETAYGYSNNKRMMKQLLDSI